MGKIEYQAYAKGCAVTADSPKNAAIMFFARFPSKRKCNIIAGESEGQSFIVRYGNYSTGEWPYSAKDITKKMIETLP